LKDKKVFAIVSIATCSALLVGLVTMSIIWAVSIGQKNQEVSDLTKTNQELTDKNRELDQLAQKTKTSDTTLKNELLSKCGDKVETGWEEVCNKLKNGSEQEVKEIIDSYTGGTAKQSNETREWVDGKYVSTGQFVGGDYRPYWILEDLAVTIPEGTKIERETNLYTNGALYPINRSEGSSSCEGDGITMSVFSTIYGGNNYQSNLRAYANQFASTTEIIPSCMGGVPQVYVGYVKYTKIPGLSDTRYAEIVTFACKDDDYNEKCVTGYDENNWWFHSGLIPSSQATLKVGNIVSADEASTGYASSKDNEILFQIVYFGDSEEDYYHANYQDLLNDAEYIKLKNIIVGIHKI
jgi:hypothetical protein